MRRPQSHVALMRRPKLETEHLREHPESRSESGVRQRAESPLSATGILRLQRTIGNQAVQRLIVQRAPAGGDDAAKEPKSVGVASITIEGRALKGESRVPGHEGKIDFTSLSRDETRRMGGGGHGGDREAGEQGFINVSFTKTQDGSSPTLLEAAATGKRVTAARFDLLRRGDSGTFETLFTFEFSNGIVTQFAPGSSSGGDTPSDFVTIEFEKPAAK